MNHALEAIMGHQGPEEGGPRGGPGEGGPRVAQRRGGLEGPSGELRSTRAPRRGGLEGPRGGWQGWAIDPQVGRMAPPLRASACASPVATAGAVICTQEFMLMLDVYIKGVK